MIKHSPTIRELISQTAPARVYDMPGQMARKNSKPRVHHMWMQIIAVWKKTPTMQLFIPGNIGLHIYISWTHLVDIIVWKKPFPPPLTNNVEVSCRIWQQSVAVDSWVVDTYLPRERQMSLHRSALKFDIYLTSRNKTANVVFFMEGNVIFHMSSSLINTWIDGIIWSYGHWLHMS